MLDQPIEQFLRQTPRRQPPNYISLSLVNGKSPAKQTDHPAGKNGPQDSTTLASVPRPPIPPRRHTLAEICRYADEQCAYIEWMTRQLEAEEAARRHSSPTTPIGAITNPFSGPADMWWRPTSANEMYGKSALRRQQEEEQETIQRQNPYLAMSGFPDLVEKDPRIEITRKDTMLTDVEEADATDNILSVPLTHEQSEIDEALMTGKDSDLDILEESPIVPSSSTCKREAWSDHTEVPVTGITSSNNQGFNLPSLKQSSIILMVLKVILCFLLLPLILVVLLGSMGWEMDGEEHREEG